MFLYSIKKKDGNKLSRLDISPKEKIKCYKWIHAQEDEDKYVIVPEFQQEVFEKYNINYDYCIEDLRKLIKEGENNIIDNIVNTILADHLNFHFLCNDDNDDRDNFVNGIIVDDYTYDIDSRPHGGSIVLYSQELYTVSLNSLEEEVIKNFPEQLNFRLNKSTVSRSLSYILSDMVLEKLQKELFRKDE